MVKLNLTRIAGTCLRSQDIARLPLKQLIKGWLEEVPKIPKFMDNRFRLQEEEALSASPLQDLIQILKLISQWMALSPLLRNNKSNQTNYWNLLRT